MTTTPHGQVPEALRLAIEFADCVKLHAIPSINDITAARRELRRLHAENATLQSGYDAARLEIDGLHARVQELERAVEAEREACAQLIEGMTERRRWVRGGINGEATKPCEYAAAIRARGAKGESNAA